VALSIIEIRTLQASSWRLQISKHNL